jgi:4-carboxymuconolactone decarboxylase
VDCKDADRTKGRDINFRMRGFHPEPIEGFEFIQDVAERVAYGEAWTRPELDLRTKSLCVVAVCMALNRPEQVGGHIHGALVNGATETEIREVLMLTTFYAGFPMLPAAMKQAVKVFAEYRQEQEAEDSAGR